MGQLVEGLSMAASQGTFFRNAVSAFDSLCLVTVLRLVYSKRPAGRQSSAKSPQVSAEIRLYKRGSPIKTSFGSSLVSR